MAERYDVLVVGAGPAGLAAARAAAAHGARVGLLDAQASPGGQVWRRDVRDAGRSWPRPMDDVLRQRNVAWLARASVVAAEHGGLWVEFPRSARRLDYNALVLATGARELLLPFPGWTLPGVTGVGGLQALAKQGWPLAGRRVTVAGSGPLLLAAAATARRHGARVTGVHEGLPRGTLMRFAFGLGRWPGKAVQVAVLRTRLLGVPYRCGDVAVRALGDDRLRAVEFQGPRGNRIVDCDHLAVGYGLVPNVELAYMLGCATEAEGAHARVRVDTRQQTSVPSIFAAGEACGIGGRECALVEGAIAGHAAAGAPARADALLRKRRHARAFADHLHRHFALDARARTLVQADTVVCRCEDVRWRALEGWTDAREAKLATRCGMGACQGRICGSALAELGRFPRDGIRPPLFPARLATLGGTDPFVLHEELPT